MFCQGLTLDQIHNQVGLSIVEEPDIVNSDQAGVIERVGGDTFLLKPPELHAVGDPRAVEHFEGHIAIEKHLTHAVHGTHAALTDPCQDMILAAQHVADHVTVIDKFVPGCRNFIV